MSRTSFLPDLLSSIFERAVIRPVGEDRRSMKALCAALLSEQGEASGTRIAAAILDRYEAADAAGKAAFFSLLASDYDVDPQAVAGAASRYGETRAPEDMMRLQEAAEPRRQKLLRRLNRSAGGTGRLVRMRAALLDLLRDEPWLKTVDLDFGHLFSSWFNQGFLVLRRIDWTTPANILEKIIAYEAVHAIDDWDDLRSRLQPADRRCFAFFHPAMPDEPLIFVEVALTEAIPAAIQPLLAVDQDPIAETRATTAVFYSISNCQRGLAGVSFGNFLIKQVAADLSVQLPNLRNFVTLSPVPGLTRWLSARAEAPDGEAAQRLLVAEVAEAVHEVAPEAAALCAEYLVEAKRSDGLPRDPVARFHLGNGASLARVNPGGDLSAKGLEQSRGVMVNYLYDLKTVEANHESYAHTHEVQAARAVRGLLG